MREYFLTGCTGWIGKHIVDELLSRQDTGSICLLTREERTHPDKRVSYWQGDILEDPLPPNTFTDVIHGANGSHFYEPMRCYYTIVEGTRRIIDWAPSNCNFLYLSSGAANRATPYGRGKLLAEQLLPYRARIARLYTLIGEGVPEHYAVGTFIQQAILDKCVTVDCGESVYRSYLHVEDAARWCLQIMDHGYPKVPYDVGGDSPWSIRSVAVTVANVFGVPIEVTGAPTIPDSYLPDVAPTKRLGAKSTITLLQALERIRDQRIAA